MAARAAFPGSILIEEAGGANHASSVFAGNPCVDDVVFAYLRAGDLPAPSGGEDADVRCARGAEPGLVEIAAAAAGETALSLLPFAFRRPSVLHTRQMGH